MSYLLYCFVISVAPKYVKKSSPVKQMFNIQHLTYQFKGCGDMFIALNCDRGRSYDIVERGYNNKRSFIRNRRNGKIIFEKSHPSTFGCDEFQYFWLSWQRGIVSYGRGSAVGENLHLKYDTKEPVLRCESIFIDMRYSFQSAYCFGESTNL